MPRRRKRLSQKAPLTFEESPINIARNIPSPVFCSDHPPTADTVQLDSQYEVPWVRLVFQTYTRLGSP